MAWDLEIHIIDIGQGDSSLIVAKDDEAMMGRTMLIDGGLTTSAKTVHDYIVGEGLADVGVDHILISHYDIDHSDGIQSLLQADNFSAICATIATVTAREAQKGDNRAQRVAIGAAAAYSAIMGAYDDRQGNDRSVQAALVTAGLKPQVVMGTGDADAVTQGLKYAKKFLGDPLNAILIKKTISQNAVARDAGIEAATAIQANGTVTDEVSTAIFNRMVGQLKEGSKFMTAGIYNDVHIIDIGDTAALPDGYLNILNGGVYLTNGDLLPAPGIRRLRTSAPALGAEIMWNSGRAPVAAPANSPALFVVACLKNIWRKGGPIGSGGGDANNADSIGLILRFNSFFYYTGGDLPSTGEEPIATAVTTIGLPDPQNVGSTFPVAARVACFKCGHHGSDHSTSAKYLNTMQSAATFISVGANQFQNENLPTQNVIDRLHNDANIEYFYLTNCRIPRNHVPASEEIPLKQLGGVNKSRLAGDNAEDNLQVGRERGDIKIDIDQAESTSVNPQFHVTYWEADSDVAAMRTEDIDF